MLTSVLVEKSQPHILKLTLGTAFSSVFFSLQMYLSTVHSIFLDCLCIFQDTVPQCPALKLAFIHIVNLHILYHEASVLKPWFFSHCADEQRTQLSLCTCVCVCICVCACVCCCRCLYLEKNSPEYAWGLKEIKISLFEIAFYKSKAYVSL